MTPELCSHHHRRFKCSHDLGPEPHTLRIALRACCPTSKAAAAWPSVPRFAGPGHVTEAESCDVRGAVVAGAFSEPDASMAWVCCNACQNSLSFSHGTVFHRTGII